MDCREKAVKCVNQYVLPEMRRQFKECGSSLDEQHKKYGDTEYFFANIIEPYHIYEIGYPRCVCQKVQSEKEADPNFCECSRQSDSGVNAVKKQLPNIMTSLRIVCSLCIIFSKAFSYYT